MSTSSVIAEVIVERATQNAKWGEQNHTPSDYFAILAEEHGEVAKEVVEFNASKTHPEECSRLRKMRTELIQEAAVAVAMVEMLERNYSFVFERNPQSDRNPNPSHPSCG